MPKAKKSGTPETPVVVAPEKKLTDEQIALGATNDPALSKDEFDLCGKKYKYVFLSYDYYMEFMLKIKPLLAATIGVITQKSKDVVTLPGIELANTSSGGIMQFCQADIPDMVRIIVNNSLEAEDRGTEKITVDQIRKTRGVTPMKLSEIIMGQVVYNNMVSDFASFFVQSMPLLRAMGILTSPKTAPSQR